DLFPKEACDGAKADMKTAGIKFVQTRPVKVHPMKESRRVPLSMLRRRLKVENYEAETPFEAVEHSPEQVRIKLSQHVGKPAVAQVVKGASVRRGDLIARVDSDALGVNIHSSIDGAVVDVTDKYIEIRA
ncbi:MAG: NADH dehydrogenase subunit, partial [Acidobacteria bacterium]|nr:NADH dehydrogenase subunit [Acidobacteriota bacterium]